MQPVPDCAQLCVVVDASVPNTAVQPPVDFETLSRTALELGVVHTPLDVTHEAGTYHTLQSVLRGDAFHSLCCSVWSAGACAGAGSSGSVRFARLTRSMSKILLLLAAPRSSFVLHMFKPEQVAPLSGHVFKAPCLTADVWL
eukprot:2548968-Rhodomonas_salina.1